MVPQKHKTEDDHQYDKYCSHPHGETHIPAKRCDGYTHMRISVYHGLHAYFRKDFCSTKVNPVIYQDPIMSEDLHPEVDIEEKKASKQNCQDSKDRLHL